MKASSDGPQSDACQNPDVMNHDGVQILAGC